MIIAPIISSLLIFTTTLISNNSTEIKVESSGNSNSSVSVSTKSNVNTNSSVKINNSDFEIEGIIDSVSSDKFTVNDQSILIDSSQVNSYKQKGILVVGNEIKVTGNIKNGVLYAENILVKEGNPEGIITDVKTDNRVPTGNPTGVPEVKESTNLVVHLLNQLLTFLKNLSN